MKTIYKYPLPTPAMDSNFVIIEMPDGAQPLHVDVQHGQVCIWAVVDPERPMVRRRIRVIGTGLDASDVEHIAYIGSVLLLNGTFVFHIFDAGISLQ